MTVPVFVYEIEFLQYSSSSWSLLFTGRETPVHPISSTHSDSLLFCKFLQTLRFLLMQVRAENQRRPYSLCTALRCDS